MAPSAESRMAVLSWSANCDGGEGLQAGLDINGQPDHCQLGHSLVPYCHAGPGSKQGAVRDARWCCGAGTYIDKKCPFTSNVSIRGRILSGVVYSTKMTRTITIRRDYLHFVKKYQR